MEMEYTAEGGDFSSMANHSPAGSTAGGAVCSAAASEESGWTTYIDYFMATQQQERCTEEASATSSSACTSPSTNDAPPESAGGHGAGAEASRLPPAIAGSSEAKASRRLILRRKKEGFRRMKLVRDESLEDTATSPISSPKLIDSRDSDGGHKGKEDAYDEISHISMKTRDDNHINNIYIENGEDASTNMISDDDAYEHNQLRKKGLCLVPVSVFHVL